ncbi:TonB-dependent receptor [Candidatus Methylospira mobilis]|uniref:TonB-dependent receptor n=1 Tax=Candidatus Methylospira mobilis TaxID=1808979 RepID=A0A5Q0BG89_9GAMM|nr:TonB-dependent receptor [Candidatus Methylospira mobilis]QFY41231.1 TonB-dependent receptor [Candidatus Methylospira mobilis]WNV05549.1 TonB-dependent receptor [Candidatus Methylospira mobilis]
MKVRLLSFSIVLTAMPLPTFAESDSSDALDPVVITATRSETRESSIANTITVITAEEIKARRLNAVVDVLRVVPGLDVMSYGGTGTQTSVFTRGANASQTLVLIDNIQMNDPGSADGAFDFANLQVDNIERIEILRGAASAMWGADAMGGVINIITKHGSGKTQFNGLAQGGNYDTWKVGGGVSGESQGLNYTLNASHFQNMGVSAAAQSMGNNEREAYQNTTVSARTGYQVTDDLDLDWTLRYNQAQVGLDNCGGSGYTGFSGNFVSCDNPYYFSNTNEVYTRGQGRLFLFDKKWEQRLGINYSLTDRQYYYTTPTLSPDWTSPSSYQGTAIKAEWLHIVHVLENDTVTAGFDGKFNTLVSQSGGSSNANGSMSNGGYYLQNQLDWLERLHTTVGGRLDDNSQFGRHMTWRFNQVIEVPELDNRIKANVGSAFKAPSLCELSLSCYGNPNLMPETSLNMDAGLEQYALDKKLKLGALYFNNQFNNLIQWNPNANGGRGQVANVSSAIARGLESFVEYKPFDDLSLRVNYTLDQTYGLTDPYTGVRTNSPLLLRPKNKGSFDLDYRFIPEASFHVNTLVVGSRSSFDTVGNVVQVPGYVLVNVSSNYDVNENIALFVRMDNLLNKRYQQVWGYGTLGFTGIGGVSVKF